MNHSLRVHLTSFLTSISVFGDSPVSFSQKILVASEKLYSDEGHQNQGCSRSTASALSYTISSPLARISHPQSTAAADTAASTVFARCTTERYVCGGLGRAPCQAGPSAASRRAGVRNTGFRPVILRHRKTTSLPLNTSSRAYA